MITGTTQSVLDWSRKYIPDHKSRLKSVRSEEIGRTALPTGQRETFYLKQQVLGSVFLYIDPYKYSVTASLGAASSTDRVFMFNATLQSCTLPDGSADPSIRPDQYKPVLAEYEYTQNYPYMYSDIELVEFLGPAVSYLNNTFGYSFTSSGTISTFEPVYSTNAEKEILAKGLAVIVRNSYADEQVRKGFGVAFRGPMAAIDSKSALKEYNAKTKSLESDIKEQISTTRLSGATGQGIDVYTENVVSQ